MQRPCVVYDRTVQCAGFFFSFEMQCSGLCAYKSTETVTGQGARLASDGIFGPRRAVKLNDPENDPILPRRQAQRQSAEPSSRLELCFRFGKGGDSIHNFQVFFMVLLEFEPNSEDSQSKIC